MKRNDPGSPSAAVPPRPAHRVRQRVTRATAAAAGIAVALCVASAANAANAANASDARNATNASGPRTMRTDLVPQVLDEINSARAQAGLPGYTITSGLTHSATAHNQAMMAGCGLSHQCAGEEELGARESAAAVRWSSAGENIAEGGPVADTDASIAQMLGLLDRDMLGETPPQDGHRRNMLSRSFRHVGIAIHRDGAGTVWMTQDFSD